MRKSHGLDALGVARPAGPSQVMLRCIKERLDLLSSADGGPHNEAAIWPPADHNRVSESSGERPAQDGRDAQANIRTHCAPCKKMPGRGERPGSLGEETPKEGRGEHTPEPPRDPS